MNIIFLLVFFFYCLSLVLPFFLVAEGISKINETRETGEVQSMDLFTVPLINLILILILILICLLMGDFYPLFELNIFLLLFGMFVITYSLSAIFFYAIALVLFGIK